MQTPTLISRSRTFEGEQAVYELASSHLGCTTRFAVFEPPRASGEPCGVLYYLSGLTCTEQNVITKAGAQRMCAQLGLLFVCPDTSPRGSDVPDSPDDDLGQGAGFYVDATQPPWNRHFRMESYVMHELLPTVDEAFVTNGKRGVMGHSMGGHGALTLALKHPTAFHSVSAIAPVASPSTSPWGTRALAAYLGQEEAAWQAHDAVCLLNAGAKLTSPLLVDQGGADPFLETHLMPGKLRAAANASGVDLVYREHPGYDHGYYFVATVIEDHIRHHAAYLV